MHQKVKNCRCASRRLSAGESAFNDVRLTNQRHLELFQQLVQLCSRTCGQLRRSDTPDIRLGQDRVSLRIDVEGSDGEFGQRRREVTELEDDAAHVERTSDEVLVAYGADVQAATTGVEVVPRGHCRHQNAERQVVVQAYAEVGAVVTHRVENGLGQPAGQSAEYAGKAHRRKDQRISIQRLGDRDDVSVEEQTSARRKHGPARTHDPLVTLGSAIGRVSYIRISLCYFCFR